MTGLRLSLALDEGGLVLPDVGRIAVFAPRADHDLSALPKARLHLITGFYPDHAALRAQGYDCATAPEGPYAAALVCLPRAKALAQGLIAQAAALTEGPVIVDGLKSDGVDSLLKACRKRADVYGPVNKAHGKLFWFEGGDFADWAGAGETELEGGFVTRAGVFSADGIDPASQLLADSLPAEIGAQVADLGAGWGYLSARILQLKGVRDLHLVEADHAALECARRNIDDPRAHFHWADATAWQAPARLDAVVMNPPFHTSRAADPDLGRRFIQSAARLLAPRGRLWLVANRHLPYEATLTAHFGETAEIAGNSRFKILMASNPSRQWRVDRLA
ncbi:class I SAM-dependent methyltransferase [Pseudooceanicola nanhaiensis]|uniref:class I SAM-dependent methyltransferase n=1 Tax=Pseudooceanicola nanhaiensis TaxID=375761 RepID=UPI001CD2C130|nr:class I SAM-dependent methyltransferase [Pseudooceanicola nanhaiensis]MCA0919012.1 class I SAM-dependent methyltransferase [Pseudooceanicola nanhaiensis]